MCERMGVYVCVQLNAHGRNAERFVQECDHKLSDIELFF